MALVWHQYGIYLGKAWVRLGKDLGKSLKLIPLKTTLRRGEQVARLRLALIVLLFSYPIRFVLG